VASLQAALLLAVLMPVYTVQQGAKLLEYEALPVARILLEWLVAHPTVLQEHGFTSRPQLWPGLAKLLNEVTPLVEGWAPGPLERYPLPEDWDLQAFSPLTAAMASLDMRQVGKLGTAASPAALARLRCHRLLGVAGRLAALGVVRRGAAGWEAGEVVGGEGEELGRLVERMEADLLEDIVSSEEEPEWEASPGPEPQGTRSILKTSDDSPGLAQRPKPAPMPRNVAMAAILKHAAVSSPGEEGEKKTVMFVTPSPGSSQASNGASEGGVEEVGESWPPAPATATATISVEQLDFSVPPPSLHSNFRPPALSAPALYCPESDSIGGVPRRGGEGGGAPRARAGGLQGIAPIPASREPSLTYTPWSGGAPGTFQPEPRADSPPPPQSSHTLAYLPSPSHAPPSPSHAPLLHTLLSSMERPEGLHSPAPSPWSPLVTANSSPSTPSYSLFSPSAWPPPSLLSPHSSPQRPPAPPTQPPAQPSPLEQLLQQTSLEK